MVCANAMNECVLDKSHGGQWIVWHRMILRANGLYDRSHDWQFLDNLLPNHLPHGVIYHSNSLSVNKTITLPMVISAFSTHTHPTPHDRLVIRASSSSSRILSIYQGHPSVDLDPNRKSNLVDYPKIDLQINLDWQNKMSKHQRINKPFFAIQSFIIAFSQEAPGRLFVSWWQFINCRQIFFSLFFQPFSALHFVVCLFLYSISLSLSLSASLIRTFDVLLKRKKNMQAIIVIIIFNLFISVVNNVTLSIWYSRRFVRYWRNIGASVALPRHPIRS